MGVASLTKAEAALRLSVLSYTWTCDVCVVLYTCCFTNLLMLLLCFSFSFVSFICDKMLNVKHTPRCMEGVTVFSYRRVGVTWHSAVNEMYQLVADGGSRTRVLQNAMSTTNHSAMDSLEKKHQIQEGAGHHKLNKMAPM